MLLLVLSAVYPPDPAAVGQYMAEAAFSASRTGKRVRVLTADRGYEKPSEKFRPFEASGGVEVIRLRWSSFGKRSYWARIAGQISYSIQVLIQGLLGPRPDVILMSTAPPFGIAVTLLLSTLRRVPFVYWVMDVNPDQAVAMGMVPRRSVFAHVMEGLNVLALRSAATVIALDSDMACRLMRKAPTKKPIMVLPLWPLQVTADQGFGRLEYRNAHHFGGKFVVMYSGNHSWVHPLDTVLQAAKELETRKDILFAFVGHGNEKPKVEKALRHGATNIVSLPFEPLEKLGDSLSAADAHLVVMGNSMIGIVHPSKIYNAMAVERPILAIAPRNCYISRLLEGNRIGLRFEHGDREGLVRGILELADMDPEERAEMGRRARALVLQKWDHSKLVGRLIEILEETARSGEASDAG